MAYSLSFWMQISEPITHRIQMSELQMSETITPRIQMRELQMSEPITHRIQIITCNYLYPCV